VRVGRIALLGAVLVGSACSESSADGESSRDAAVVEAVIRTLVAEMPVEPDVKPVVYVVGLDGGGFSIDVQAAVAAALVDDVELRFADDREEAILDDVEQLPVRDDGTLIVIGAVPPEGNEVEVVVERYVDEEDHTEMVFSLRRRTEDWAVQSTVVAPVVTVPEATLPETTVPERTAEEGSGAPAVTEPAS
jgi:hypothetical protein